MRVVSVQIGALWRLMFRFARTGGIPIRDGALYNPARGEFGIRVSKERMTDENGEVVDGDWERDSVFDGDRAWDANCAIAEDDRGQRNESATGRDLERVLAGVFG